MHALPFRFFRSARARAAGLAPVAIAAMLAVAACAAPSPRPAAAPAASAAPPVPLSLIPEPAQLSRCDGTFALSPATALQADGDGAAPIARWFADLTLRTRKLALADTDSGHGRIVFHLDPATVAPATDADAEAYSLHVDAARVEVRAQTAHGLFNGAVTLWQLATLAGADTASIPCLRIEDRPRFAWRGLMLDPARHFQSVAFTKQFIDWMALHKFNVLQWHLTDDQGWRIEIKRYPKLTNVGAWRQPAGAAGLDEHGKPMRVGGFYTQDEIRDVVAYAQARFITVVPEIEMPGHAQAAIAAYPQLGVTGRNPGVSHDWGVHSWLYNVDDATFTFLENVLDEVMALFPSPYIHIGGDEAAKDQWIASPRIQARKRALGLADEAALQAWFTKRIEKYLSAHGRKLIGWDEILEGGIPDSATVMSWRGTKGAIEAARQGHDVVLAPDPNLYLDHLPGDLPDEPAGRPAVISLQDVYGFEVVPHDLDAAQAAHVLGAQAPLWSEYFRTGASVARAAFPRAAALAEVLWSPPATHDWQSFLARLPGLQARYRLLGLPYAPDAFAVHIDATLDAERRQAHVTMHNQTAFGTIRYTTDGSAPDAHAPAYSTALDLPAQGVLRATAFDSAGVPLADARSRDLSVPALLTRSSVELAPCRSGGVVLKLPEDAPANATGDAFVVEIFDPRWKWPQAPLQGIDHADVAVATMPYNFQLSHDAKSVVERKPTRYPAGELQVFVDACDGKPARVLPLAPLRAKGAPMRVEVPLADLTGAHDVCLRFATGRHDPLWVVRSVALVPK